MSPEQARGKPVDRRTDVWAFGCVLYECLTGERAFAGDSFSDLVAAILHEEPDWSRLPEATPTGVRRVLARCLARDKERRLRHLGDVALDLAAGGDAHARPRARLRASKRWINPRCYLGTVALEGLSAALPAVHYRVPAVAIGA